VTLVDFRISFVRLVSAVAIGNGHIGWSACAETIPMTGTISAKPKKSWLKFLSACKLLPGIYFLVGNQVVDEE